jgi:hypothetical protein
MNARPILLWGFALATASLAPACSSAPAAASGPSDASTPLGPSTSDDDAGSAPSSSSSSGNSSSSGGSPSLDSGSPATSDDSGTPQHDSGTKDASTPRDSGACIRPPYQTTDECTGIGKPGGPVIPSCSEFNADGQLLCPSIPGCTVVPDPTGNYCMGDNVTCGLSDCGHICLLPDWDPCYDVATGKCLEGC